MEGHAPIARARRLDLTCFPGGPVFPGQDKLLLWHSLTGHLYHACTSLPTGFHTPLSLPLCWACWHQETWVRHIQWAYSLKAPSLLSLSRIPDWIAPRYPGGSSFCLLSVGSLELSSLDKGPGYRDTMGRHQGTGRDPRIVNCPTVSRVGSSTDGVD